MLLEKQLIHLLNHLSQEKSVTITLGESDITIRVYDYASKLSLQTSVYQGGNYIPKSVRSNVSQKAVSPIPSEIITFLTIDEPQFQINLNYLGRLDAVTKTGIKELLEEFTIVADRWRDYLDEQDRNDLVRVPVK